MTVTTTDASQTNDWTSSSYSFFLNVVVMEHMHNSVVATTKIDEEVSNNNDGAIVNLAPVAAKEVEQPPRKFTSSLTNGKMFHFDAVSNVLDKSIHNSMKIVSKSSRAVSERAAGFIERKTMVSRASAAISKSLSDVEAELNGDQSLLEISKRFQQGPVTVLKVVMKAAALPQFIELVEGEHVAEHFNAARTTLKMLEAHETVASLEREILPRIRKGLMEKVSSLLLSTIKDNEDGSLEVECIALEEPEEATWLFTFMEFHSQMK